MDDPTNSATSRYNLRTLRGERVTKKKEGKQLSKWESDYKQLVSDPRNIIAAERVIEEICLLFENDSIEQTNISLICPLSKERIRVPARYKACRHLQCFDLKVLLEMKTKRNFLVCPICSVSVTNELSDLRIDRYFEGILSEISNTTKVQISRDGNFTATPVRPELITPKIIDDEKPFVSDNTTLINETKPGMDDFDDINSHNGEYEDQIFTTESANDTSEHADGIGHEEERAHSEFSSSMNSIFNYNGDVENNRNASLIQPKNNTKRFKCDLCPYSGNRKEHVKVHMRIHTGEKPYKCNRCVYMCADNGTLAKHMRAHTGERPFKCNQCSYASTQGSALNVHMRIHAGEKPYKCSQCSFSTRQGSGLTVHMRTHTGEKPYKCTQCSFVTAGTASLEVHMRIHTGEKPYKCDQCLYSSSQITHLRTHMRTHTGEKPYKCNQCSFASSQKTPLTIHMRIHTGEKPYTCSQCSYSAIGKNSLVLHMRTHTGEKPYKCKQCTFAACRFSQLEVHKRSHSGEKPYKCNQCSFSASQTTDLKRHMQRHTGEKAYKCSICPYASFYDSNLRSHMRTHQN